MSWGWTSVLVRVVKKIGSENIPLVAAGVSFYATLAIFPALIAIVSIYGLVSDANDLERELRALSGALPASAQALMLRQLTEIVRSSPTALGWGVVLSIAGVLWSAASGAKGLIKAVNLACHAKRKRNFVHLTALALVFAVGIIVVTVVVLFAIAALPRLLALLGVGSSGVAALAWLRWPVLFLLVLGALAVFYTYAPADERPRFRSVAAGAASATALWTAASLLFSWYVSSFSKLNQTYGTLAGVIVLLLWFYISGVVVLLGAELNAELERRRAPAA